MVSLGGIIKAGAEGEAENLARSEARNAARTAVKGAVKSGAKSAERSLGAAASESASSGFGMHAVVAGATPVLKDQAKNAEKGLKIGSDIVHEIRINGLLSGPITQAGNMFDGAINTLAAPLETFTKVGVSAGRSTEDKTHLYEAAQGLFGMFHGFEKSLNFAGRRLKAKLPGQNETIETSMKKLNMSPELTKSSKLGDYNRSWTAENMGLDPDSFYGRAVEHIGNLINLPGSSLNFADTLTKQINYTRKQFEEAAHMVKTGRAKNMKQGLQIAENDPILLKNAIEESERRTYTNQPEMAFTKWITSKEIDKLPGARWVVPFRRATANILERGFEYTPLVATSPVLRAKLFSKEAAVADAARSKLAFGMMFMATASYMLKDHIVGQAPEEGNVLVSEAPRDQNLKQMYLQINGGENYLNILGFKVPFKYMSWQGTFLQQLANYNQWLSNVKEVTIETDGSAKVDQGYMKYATSVMEKFVDNSWGGNVIDFTTAITRTIQSEDMKYIRDYFERNLKTAIPFIGSNAFGQHQKMQDPYVRKAQEPGDIIKSLSPKYKHTLPVTYLFDGTKAVYSKMASSDEVEKWRPKITPLDRKLLGLQVKFAEIPDYVPVTNKKEPKGVPPTMMEVTEADAAKIALALQHGISGYPSAREFLKTQVFPNMVFSDMYKKYPHFQKIFVEESYSEYLSGLTKIIKGDMSPGAMGDRIMKATLARGEFTIGLMNERNN